MITSCFSFVCFLLTFYLFVLFKKKFEPKASCCTWCLCWPTSAFSWSSFCFTCSSTPPCTPPPSSSPVPDSPVVVGSSTPASLPPPDIPVNPFEFPSLLAPLRARLQPWMFVLQFCSLLFLLFSITEIIQGYFFIIDPEPCYRPRPDPDVVKYTFTPAAPVVTVGFIFMTYYTWVPGSLSLFSCGFSCAACGGEPSVSRDQDHVQQSSLNHPTSFLICFCCCARSSSHTSTSSENRKSRSQLASPPAPPSPLNSPLPPPAAVAYLHRCCPCWFISPSFPSSLLASAMNRDGEREPRVGGVAAVVDGPVVGTPAAAVPAAVSSRCQCRQRHARSHSLSSHHPRSHHGADAVAAVIAPARSVCRSSVSSIASSCSSPHTTASRYSSCTTASQIDSRGRTIGRASSLSVCPAARPGDAVRRQASITELSPRHQVLLSATTAPSPPRPLDANSSPASVSSSASSSASIIPAAIPASASASASASAFASVYEPAFASPSTPADSARGGANAAAARVDSHSPASASSLSSHSSPSGFPHSRSYPLLSGHAQEDPVAVADVVEENTRNLEGYSHGDAPTVELQLSETAISFGTVFVTISDFHSYTGSDVQR